jgi:hypothetical protein
MSSPDTIDHAADHGCRSDAQAKSQNGNDSKTGILSQHPQAVAKVVPNARRLISSDETPN